MHASRRRLNILYVGTLPPHPGGSAISGAGLLVGLTRLGHAIRAVAPISGDALGCDTFAASYPSIRITRFPVPYFETAPDTPPSDDYREREGEQVRAILSILIEEERPDVLFIGRETFAWHVPDVARAHSLPCILRLAGGTTAGILNGTFSEVLVRALLEQYRKVHLLVSPATHLALQMRRLGLRHTIVIPNAIDLHQFSPRPKDGELRRRLAITDDDIVVGHVSNLTAVKRPIDVIRSATQACRENSRLVYVIVGDGPLRRTMEELCTANHGWDRVRFVGWVDYHRVPDYINLVDIVVMPSECEALARVYLETQACARLLLASDIPAAREVIVDGESGLLFRKGDIEDLTAKTLLAASDPTLRARVGRTARERVQAHSIDDAVATYAATFDEVVRRHRQGARSRQSLGRSGSI